MSPAITKTSNKIHNIVRVRHMLRRWRHRSSSSSSASTPSSHRFIATDVPAGHVAICVGTNYRRFIVRATYLNHPLFQKLLTEAEEEYGFNNIGPLTIPCEESEFEQILRFVSRPESNRFVNLEDFKRCCHVGYVGDQLETKPLLHGSVC